MRRWYQEWGVLNTRWRDCQNWVSGGRPRPRGVGCNQRLHRLPHRIFHSVPWWTKGSGVVQCTTSQLVSDSRLQTVVPGFTCQGLVLCGVSCWEGFHSCACREACRLVELLLRMLCLTLVAASFGSIATVDVVYIVQSVLLFVCLCIFFNVYYCSCSFYGYYCHSCRIPSSTLVLQGSYHPLASLFLLDCI